METSPMLIEIAAWHLVTAVSSVIAASIYHSLDE